MAAENTNTEQEPTIPTREIAKKERWKLKKPHPFWRPDLVYAPSRLEEWQELSENQRIYQSDILGPRR